MKPCFGKLVIPNVPAGHRWTGEKVKVITPQGYDLYIRSLLPLNFKVSSTHYVYLHVVFGFDKCNTVNSGAEGWVENFKLQTSEGGIPQTWHKKLCFCTLKS